jgi:hypothetical protein
MKVLRKSPVHIPMKEKKGYLSQGSVLLNVTKSQQRLQSSQQTHEKMNDLSLSTDSYSYSQMVKLPNTV